MEKPINGPDYIRTGQKPFFSDEIKPEFLYDQTGEEMIEHSLDAPMWTALGGMTKFEGMFGDQFMHGSSLRQALAGY